MKSALIPLLLAVVAPVVAQPTRQWSHGNPSGEEQYALEVINRIRRDPVAAADFYIGQEGMNPVLKTAIAKNTYSPNGSQPLSPEDSLRAYIRLQLDYYNNSASAGRTKAPKAPLAFYPLFNQQAAAQNLVTGTAKMDPAFDAADFFNTTGAALPGKVVAPKIVRQLGLIAYKTPSLSGQNATGGTATIKAGGSTPGSPVGFGRDQLLYVANYYDTRVSLREAFVMGSTLDVFLDDSFTANTTSLTSTTYGKTRLIGISLGAPRDSSPGLGSRVLSVFATDNEAFQTSDLPFGADTVFITGVVYQDTDKDGDYTPGEGVAGVRVTPSSGDWYAITSSSGGFAIPVSKNAGAITVTAKGGSAASNFDAATVVTVSSDSVKVDFVRQNTSKPTQSSVEGTDGSNQFINLSTRGVAEAGDKALIGGFVIAGTGKKSVLIRGVANSLTSFGITGVLRKPLLTLYNDKSVPIRSARTSDTYSYEYVDAKWVVVVKPDLVDVFKKAGAFAFITTNAPTTDLNGSAMRSLGESDGIRPVGDVAMVVELDPGLYSVAITPDADTTPQGSIAAPANSGLVLLEIYDLAPTSGSRFVNLSTRGKIESGVRQMIVGFVISGSGHRRLLVRGVGPTLKTFGLVGALDDSEVELYASEGQSVARNDDWTLSTWANQAVSSSVSVGAFALPDFSRDGVILTRVTPGLYSAAVRSTSGQTGVGLAEIYEN